VVIVPLRRQPSAINVGKNRSFFYEQPITLEDGLLREVTEVARRYAHRCDRDKIPSRPRWTEPPATAPAPSADEHPDRGDADADVDAVPAAAKS